jgi:hypothetical protein
MILTTGNKTCGNNSSNKQFAQLSPVRLPSKSRANKNIATHLFCAAPLDPYYGSVIGHWF